MHNRRIFLKSFAPIAAAIAFPDTSEAKPDLCQFYANGLAEALSEKHGGSWSVKADAENEFVIVSRVFR